MHIIHITVHPVFVQFWYLSTVAINISIDTQYLLIYYFNCQSQYYVIILRKIFVYLYVLCDQDLGDNSKVLIKIAEVSLTTLIIDYIINYQMIMKCFYLKAVTQGNFFLQLTTIVCVTAP